MMGHTLTRHFVLAVCACPIIFIASSIAPLCCFHHKPKTTWSASCHQTLSSRRGEVKVRSYIKCTHTRRKNKTPNATFMAESAKKGGFANVFATIVWTEHWLKKMLNSARIQQYVIWTVLHFKTFIYRIYQIVTWKRKLKAHKCNVRNKAAGWWKFGKF